MNIIEKIEKIANNRQNILSLEKESEELMESVESTTFKVKVGSVAFGYKTAYKGDTVKVYDNCGNNIKLIYKDNWKMFSYSELELLFKEVE